MAIVLEHTDALGSYETFEGNFRWYWTTITTESFDFTFCLKIALACVVAYTLH